MVADLLHIGLTCETGGKSCKHFNACGVLMQELLCFIGVTEHPGYSSCSQSGNSRVGAVSMSKRFLQSCRLDRIAVSPLVLQADDLVNFLPVLE